MLGASEGDAEREAVLPQVDHVTQAIHRVRQAQRRERRRAERFAQVGDGDTQALTLCRLGVRALTDPFQQFVEYLATASRVVAFGHRSDRVTQRCHLRHEHRHAEADLSRLLGLRLARRVVAEVGDEAVQCRDIAEQAQGGTALPLRIRQPPGHPGRRVVQQRGEPVAEDGRNATGQ
ncbi:hypothetical protein KCV01_g18337, partial [Aureobasidium melanogenum]